MKAYSTRPAITRLLAAVLFIAIFSGCLFAFAAIGVGAVGAVSSPSGEMTDIDSCFAGYEVQSTKRIDDGGYVGEVQYTVYYDEATHGGVTPGYKTDNPVIIYAVNTCMERVGTDSNTSIIQSMLDRGFVVVVLDYLGNEKAVSPAIDYSTQAFRTKISGGSLFSASCFTEGGEYPENFLVPSGCDIVYADVFWEIDKHAADGTLEKIVENWNTDFKGKKGNYLVKWANGNTIESRKPTASYKGTAVTWYNSSGAVDSDGLYTKVKWTVASRIEDCVNPDGSPIDLNMYIHTVYPTNPAEAVPMMVLANSSNYPTSMQTGADPRAHFNGFLFQGYAHAVFDYLWHPMAQSASFGYYDGNLYESTKEQLPTVTTDHMNYSIHLYNDKLLNTAALRYLRYLSLSGGKTYNFDINNFGVVGNSKGGWFTFLGEKVLQDELVDPSLYGTTAELEGAIDEKLASFAPKRYFDDHHGETRYQAGKTADTTQNGAVIDGGELQPYLTYEGKEILSGCQLVYASNGSQEEDFSEGHAPTFVALHIFDTYNAAYGSANLFANLCRRHDVPSMIFEVPLGHMLAYGTDMNYGVDTYLAFFDFAHYHLRDEAVKVVYITPLDNGGDISSTTSVTVKFSGPVDEENIKKVRITDSSSNEVAGVWCAEFGKTEWTFTPTSALLKGEGYTVTVPTTLKGDNGKALAQKYTSQFTTESTDTIPSVRLEGNHVSFCVPTLNGESSGYALRFFVSNDAANVASIYAVDSMSDTSGEALGKVNLKGAGYYELDISDYLADKSGKKVYFYICATNEAGETVHYNAKFNATLNGNKAGPHATATVEDGALKVFIENNDGRYVTGNGIRDTFYENNTLALSNTAFILDGQKITDADYGRRFVISFRVYDEVARVLQFKLNSCSSSTNKTIDYDHFVQNLYTKAGEWVEYELVYEIYESDYGAIGYNSKTLAIHASPTGDTEIPFYLDDLKVTEIVTDVEIGYVDITEKEGMYPYKVDTGSPFCVTNGDETKSFSTLRAALAALTDGGTVTLMQNYTVQKTDDINIGTVSGLSSFTLDLNGYTLNSESTSLFTAYINRKSTNSLSITVKDGKISLKDESLISFAGSIILEEQGSISYSLTLLGVELELSENAQVTELIADVNDSIAAKLTLAVSLKDCELIAREENFSGGYLTLFPVRLDDEGLVESNPSFKVHYTVEGGKIALTKAKRIRLTTDPSALIFTPTASGYTTLTLPSSIRFSQPEVPSGFIYYPPLDASYKKSDGTEEGCTFVAYKSDGGVTEYAPIPTTAAENPSKYPFVIFSESGLYLDAASTLYFDTGAVNIAKTYLASNQYDEIADSYVGEVKSAYITMRRDYTLAANEGYPNFAQIKNTLTVDLCGYTLYTGEESLISYEAKMWSASSGAKVFPTEMIFKNGTVKADGEAVIYLTAWEYDQDYSVTGKLSTLSYENIDFIIGSKADGQVSFGEKTPTAATAFNITYDGCRFDLRSAKEGFALFGADHALWSVCYTVSNCEISASDGDSFVLTAVDSSTNEKNAILFGADAYGGGLTLVCDGEWGSDAGVDYLLTTGESTGFITNALGEHVLCYHICESDCKNICALCGSTAKLKAPTDHTYSLHGWDAASHWMECKCGEVDPSTLVHHSGGEATCSAKAVCEVCDEPYGETLPHTYGYTVADTSHTLVCSICGAKEESAHEYRWEKLDSPTEDGMTHIGTCVCGKATYSRIEDDASVGSTNRPDNLIIIVASVAAAIILLGASVTAIIVVRKKKT
ncbi:MAG: Ig-like domain-containing protein [Clostridia bacterium]|nr:Ig-like domain-containing protein [Clostridia bacterium]